MIEMGMVELDAEAERLVLQVLRSGRLAQGPMVERFENEFARMVGTRHAVAVRAVQHRQDGLDALDMALRVAEAAGVDPPAVARPARLRPAPTEPRRAS